MERPYVETEKCTGCGACNNVCPVSVFVIEKNKSVVKHPDKCIQCRACEVSCPEDAIKIK